MWAKNRLSDNVGPCQALFEHTTACAQRRAPFRSYRGCCFCSANRRLIRDRFAHAGFPVAEQHYSVRGPEEFTLAKTA